MSPSHRCCHGTAVHEVYEEVTELLPSCPVPVMCPHFFANTPSAALCLAAFPSWASEQVGFSPSKPLRLKRAPLMEVQTPSGTQVVAKGLTSCRELDKPNRSLGRRVRSRKPLRDRWTPGVASLAEVCSSGMSGTALQEAGLSWAANGILWDRNIPGWQTLLTYAGAL